MGVEFGVNLLNVCNGVTEIGKVTKDFEKMVDRLLILEKGIKSCSSLNACRYALIKLIGEMESENKAIYKMRSGLARVVTLYKNTENILIDNSEDTKGIINGYINSIVYDDEGAYGGDQAGPMQEWGKESEKEELYAIVRKYYPHMSDRKIKKFFQKLNSEGCGYVALVNTIFAEYEGREEEFEKDFGFPMYYNGDLNYNKLLVDLYAATDNHCADENGNDIINKNEDESSTDGRGTNAYDREYRLQKYLKDKNTGIEMVQTIYGQDAITVDNFMEYAKEGHVVISYRYGNLQNEDGSVAQYIDGGHAMTVVGVTPDGRFIVSSWGEKYYIDPQEIISKNTGDGENTTEFSFQVIDYRESGM